MSPRDRERIAAALQDESKSFRAIARELGVSDWVVRRVYRQISGDDRPMRGHALGTALQTALQRKQLRVLAA
jgi:transposase-like protein